MSDTQSQSLLGRKRILLTLLLPILLLLVMAQVLVAQEIVGPLGGTPAQLNGSKEVNKTEALPSETVHYTIIISNSGGSLASGVVMTDTLPTEFEYVSGTLSLQLTNALSNTLEVVNNVVMFEGTLNGDTGEVEIGFDAVLTDTAVAGDLITNTAQVTGTGSLLTPAATIEVSDQPTTFTTYLPIVFKPFLPPTLLSVGVPTTVDGFTTNSMLVTWEDIGISGVVYELQESNNADFSDSNEYAVGSGTTKSVTHDTSFNAQFYYRVRYSKDGLASPWSNTVKQTAAYWDKFDDASSGWAMRRQDTDDTNNSTQYTNGQFKMKIGGRWDFMIASPLVPIGENWPSYRISTKTILGDGVDNLQSHGVIFGADWDGVTPCPAGNYGNCFNQYYRLNTVWTGHKDLKVQIKRINSHNTGNNTTNGDVLMEFRFVDQTRADDWNDWSIDVMEDGTIILYVAGAKVYTGHDTKYIGGGRYFGMFASADEYLGTAAYYEHYKVIPLP